MDAWSVQALVFFTTLLPGFLARAIVGALTAKKQIGDLASIVESFLFSILVYIGLFLIKPDLIHSLLFSLHFYHPNRVINTVPPVLYYSFGAALIIGLTWSFLVNYDIIFKILRKLKLTTSTARESVWMDIFHDMKDCSVIVTLGDDRRIFGYPHYFSSDQEENCIFLSSPEWVDEKNAKFIPLQVKGVLLTKNQCIKRIEFLNNEN